RVRFTHGDISPHNILVDDAQRPVGLVDFGCVAWTPECWDYTMAVYQRRQYPGSRSIYTPI
ncbi:hypothetical protein BC834DRAFT_799442, partial [Gloeopeniophorella convolvens]